MIDKTAAALTCAIKEKWQAVLEQNKAHLLDLTYNPQKEVKAFYRCFSYSSKPIIIFINLAKAKAHEEQKDLNRPFSKRLKDTLLPESPDAMNFTKLKLSTQQLLCSSQINSKNYHFISNKFPLFPYTFLRVNTSEADHIDADEAQFLNFEFLESSLTLIENNPQLRLWFNGIGAAASVNSLHEQGVLLRRFPIEQEPYTLFTDCPGRDKHTNTRIHIFERFPSRGIRFSSKDKHSLNDVAYHFIQMLQINNIGHNLFNYYDHKQKELVVIVFVRRGQTHNFALSMNLATPELCGLITVNSKQYIEKIKTDPSLIFKAMNENIQPLRELKALLNDFMSLVHRKSIGQRSLNKKHFAHKHLKKLIERLENNPHQIRTNLIKARSWNPSYLIKKQLIERIKMAHTSEDQKIAACFALSLIGTEEAIKALATVYETSAPTLRQAAIRACTQIGGQQTIKQLLDALKDPWWAVQIDAVLGLAKTANPISLQVDCFMLDLNRRQSIRQEVRLALRTLLQGQQHPLVQAAANIALGELGFNLS